MKYPNWDYGYEDFINQYKPTIVIDRTSIVEVGEREIADEWTYTNEQGEEVTDYLYQKKYYIIGEEEEFMHKGVGKTLTEWKDTVGDKDTNHVYKVIENWITVNFSTPISTKFKDNEAYFVKSWFSYEPEPSFDATFRFVLVVEFNDVPGCIVNFNVSPTSRIDTKGIVEGIINAVDSDYDMEANKKAEISYDGNVNYYILDGFGNRIVTASWIAYEYGLDMPEILENNYDYSKLNVVPYPYFLAGMRASFPGYKYKGDPEVHFPKKYAIWPGTLEIPNIDFSSMVGDPINREISTAEDLVNMRFGPGMTFELVNDITIDRLPSISNFWNSVVDSQYLELDHLYSDYLTLDLYGNGHTITVNYQSNGGLIEFFRGGTIRDIIFKNADIVGDSNCGLVINKVRYTTGENVVDTKPTKLKNIKAVNCHVETIGEYDSNLTYITSVGAGGLIGTINDISWGEN
ncbi:MAG: hypothetical protein AWL62_2172 [Halanaerobium sp. T82-1]|nr:MAG: hypothetical protein AWL62_2172 [Halanaerobium sp. T82-1]